jgi:hypothetical protein
MLIYMPADCLISCSILHYLSPRNEIFMAVGAFLKKALPCCLCLFGYFGVVCIQAPL